MTEKEIRTVLQRFCADLDEAAKRAVRAGKRGVVPAIIGTGLAVGACGDDTRSLYAAPAYGVPYDAGTGGDGGSGAMAGGGTGGDSGHGGDGGA